MTLVCMMLVSFKPDGSDVKHEGHGYVDLGLSVKWATCNVGATSPEDFGHCFAWGETSPKDEYTEDNCSIYGKQMNDISGNPQYDAATANWGGDWRMPTEYECDELIDKCKWVWVTVNGVEGCKVTGPNGNSIFLPAGWWNAEYWSSESCRYYLNNHLYASYLYFDSDRQGTYCLPCCDGKFVRPVVE